MSRAAIYRWVSTPGQVDGFILESQRERTLDIHGNIPTHRPLNTDSEVSTEAAGEVSTEAPPGP